MQRKQKHGHTVGGALSPTYRTWSGMKERTTNKRHSGYKYYGGRGIKVCARWARFENFLADMGPRPAGETLDRINPAKGYAPGNCRWATRREQALNRRPRKTAEAKPMNDAAKGLNLNNDADYAIYIRRLNTMPDEAVARRHSPGQYKTPVGANPDNLDHE